MQTSPMRSSLFSKYLLFLFLCTGISLLTMGQTNGTIPEQVTYKTSIFDSSFTKVLYKGSLDISKHHLTGLFFLKRISDNSVRIVFSNELGMNYFDLELKGDKLIIHSCFPSLKRNSLLHLIENDFRLLMVPDTTIKRMKRSQSKDLELIVFRVKSARGSFLYSYPKGSGKICCIQTMRSIIGKTILLVSGYKRFNPAKVNISNPAIRLNLHMIFLSN